MKEYEILGTTSTRGKYGIVHCVEFCNSGSTKGYKVNKVFVPADELDSYIPGKFFTVRCRKYGDKWFEFSTKKVTDKPINETFLEVKSLDELPF